ncbi:hypothetical protein O181_114216 [Austropuccinia psidii MF-1]|uniref:Reverse transcriptase Ty1/copia-type domain-containing protein n=1 Tax=Austropuccinia psidii MF-1 TaxID=1389203 RepID=A0A9Q3K5T8_9BASI|nr:hypothetical protein [Austropuccinia psidii MF-1]
MIGSLNYIGTNTRPDITFAITHLSQFLEQPSLNHWLASLQVLFYLYHTRGKTLNYHNNGKCNITSYADADWGNSLINRRYIGGYTLFLNHHLISWRTKKQQTISHPTTKEEYQSLSDSSKEILWFQQLLKETNLKLPGSHQKPEARTLLHLYPSNGGRFSYQSGGEDYFAQIKVIHKRLLTLLPPCSLQGRLLKSITNQNLPSEGSIHLDKVISNLLFTLTTLQSLT